MALDKSVVKRIAVQSKLATEDEDGLICTDLNIFGFAQAIYALGVADGKPKTKLYMTTEYGGGFNVDTEENYNKTNPDERIIVYTNDWN